ncbi:MAG: glycosyltransferase family 4 protein [Pyrinomonadaceae bacterium]|nr:glycosyltransferase family 4 protein [Sphingobacteriaceae bacterium]
MRIAYVSYEYPPDTAVGGIATYVYQIANTMHQRGHQVEVFCASAYRTVSEQIDGIKIHRVLCKNRTIFNEVILPFFELSNNHKKFDIVESPEFSADGLAIKLKYPDIPLVVKLHTPWFLIGEMNNSYFGFIKKVKFITSGLIRGKLYKPFWKIRDKQNDPDYLITKLADQIHTPSISLGDIVSTKWDIQRGQILHVPYSYIPNNDLLKIPTNTDTNTITYVGRLEVRKGLVELSKAIAIVLKTKPSVKFRFVGSVQGSPKQNIDMKAYLISTLKKYKKNLEFMEVSSDKIYTIYADTDICVFPSIWENFPNTCLEAMSAGRGIVASKNGGMKDMLEDCSGGILINPLKPNEIANALILLINQKSLRIEMGTNARKKVLYSYDNGTIGLLMEQKYQALIH